MPKFANHLIPDWQPDPAIAKWADQNKFGSATEMSEASLRALRKRSSKPPVGLYMWESEKHEIYIGISNASVCTRLRQHVANYPEANIQRFRYRANAGNRSALRDIERDLIHDALAQGFTVFNREHSAVIHGASVFDDKISVERQQAWFHDPVGQNSSISRALSRTASDEARARKRFEKFVKLPFADDVLDALSLYLRACTPFPEETENEYWSLTCLPQWSDKRIVTLNMGYLEMFYAHHDPRKKRTSIYVGADSPTLPPARTWLRNWRSGMKRRGLVHAIGAPNEEGLEFTSVESFIEVMTTSPEVRQAVARFALDRMRKGRVAGRYRDAHNVLLADSALDRATRWTPATFGSPH